MCGTGLGWSCRVVGESGWTKGNMAPQRRVGGPRTRSAGTCTASLRCAAARAPSLLTCGRWCGHRTCGKRVKKEVGCTEKWRCLLCFQCAPRLPAPHPRRHALPARKLSSSVLAVCWWERGGGSGRWGSRWRAGLPSTSGRHSSSSSGGRRCPRHQHNRHGRRGAFPCASCLCSYVQYLI